MVREGIRPPVFANKFARLDFDAVPAPVISLYPPPVELPLEGCQLEVSAVDEPLCSIPWADLSALPSVKLKAPMICQIFNWSEVLEWEGVRLSDVLDAFKIETPPEGYYAIYSRDGAYFEAMSAVEARDPRVLLAYRLNGEPLPAERGGPLRLVVPFLQGYKSVKWVSSIRGFRKDPIGIKRLLGHSPSGRLTPEWTARYAINAPAPVDTAPVATNDAASSSSPAGGTVVGANLAPSDHVDLTPDAETSLKEILAFLRPGRHQLTRQALEAAGVVSYTTFRVLGRGRQRGLRFPDAAMEEAAIHFLPKQCFSIVVEESQVPKALEAIVKANRTGQGEHGDGKVFVLDVSEVVRISTDERGAVAI